MNNETIRTGVCVVGGGSAGFGAAMAAARRGANVVLVEERESLGGTSTLGGVNCWEPGISGPGVHYELYKRLAAYPSACGIGKTMPSAFPGAPIGFSRIDRSLSYESTLRRSGIPWNEWQRFHFEPSHMSLIMEELLINAGVTILLRSTLVSAELSGDRIKAITAYALDGSTYFRIEAKTFIDSTGDILLARKAGCEVRFGDDTDDAAASPQRSNTVNGISLIMRVALAEKGSECAETPAWMLRPEYCAWFDEKRNSGHFPGCAIDEYPNGDLNLNILPVMEGGKYFSLSPEERMLHLKARAFAYWRWLWAEKGFDKYRFVSFAPMPGVRESFRLNGKYTLTGNDITAGFTAQMKQDEFIAFADHALDTHGDGGRCQELKQPYGIPFSCLLPRETSNLLVACRGASFSHTAASSCRLSRTMIALGEAAGAGAVAANRHDGDTSSISMQEIRAELGIPGFEEKL